MLEFEVIYVNNDMYVCVNFVGFKFSCKPSLCKFTA